ncbi:Ribonuclease H [Desulfurobacterium thermolithotrophum DSM 11699]|uniref:Ribonuclease HII n=1 Tax=Desulfurobacterium thermolithotrophum (strain DSM 11699 / BSA) TaxID=868864 RepID=F0S3C0_DESTD|nr:ribonuclease HII [Desulfurobacterium thermolithotrophum]ADY73342.1 Ribonuclease H [Desulfurobacterium thermolithotrophum DSM 11699]
MDDKEVIIQFEREYWNKGYKLIAGIDEAGRGPLAGPVVAAAVIFPQSVIPFLFKDSKKLTEKRRKELFFKIFEKAICVGVGFADSLEIDKLNILNATKLAVKRALSSLPVQPDFLITDALEIEEFKDRSLVLTKGDEKSFSCACASVVAKVTRDFIMEKLAELFPAYGFEKHKGYPTKFHISKIEEIGISPVHRRSFGRVREKKERGIGREDSFPLSVEERLLYYQEKLQELLRGD